MNITISISWHNFLLGVIVTVLLITACYFLHRGYKKVARRCRKKGCGSLNMKRINKIYLGEGETISFRNVDGKRRWWIRRVSKETFAECKECGHTVSVKYNEDPISMWHAKWVKDHDPDQYENDPRLNNISYQAGKDRLSEKHLKKIDEHSVHTDSPPFRL